MAAAERKLGVAEKLAAVICDPRDPLRVVHLRAIAGEPGWRFKIRKPLLMSTGQIWQGRVHSRPRGRDFVVVSFFEGETDGFETN